jgi:hypothetical protein
MLCSGNQGYAKSQNHKFTNLSAYEEHYTTLSWKWPQEPCMAPTTMAA